MSWLSRDIAYGIRTLRKSPAFALTAIMTLALGIGASTAIFSVVNAVLLRPLPYAQADRLAIVSQDLRTRGVIDFPVGPGDIPDLRRGMPAFEQIAALQTTPTATFTNQDGSSELVSTAAVTTNMFSVLGLPVEFGRDFTSSDGTPNQIQQVGAAPAGGAPPAAAPAAPPLPVMGILGYDFWQRKFGGDRSIVGKTITLFGGPVEIVGVASPRAELVFPVRMRVERRPDVWTALRADFENASRINVQYRLVGRLKPGATITQARGQAARVTSDMQARFPLNQTAGVTYHVEPMKQYLVADVRTPILALMGAVVFVLLIACANVANLMLVRASQRERELAVRSAMGGSAWSIIRQLLSESLVLAGIAAAAGIVLAVVGIRLLLRLSPDNLPRLADVSLDPRVLVFAIAVSVISAVLFGLVPALRASRPDLAQVLRAAGRTPGLGGAARLRSIVIIAEVTLSFVLLVGSGLMIRSFITLTHTDPGFAPDGVLTFGLANTPRVRSLAEAQAFFATVQDKLRGVPGVTAVVQTSSLPLDGTDPSARWGTQTALADPSRFRQAGTFAVGAGYFEAMHTRLIAGRTFNQSDNDTSSKSVILDEAAAQIAFGNTSPLGKTIFARVRTNNPEAYTVVGVVQHERHLTLYGDEKESLFFPNAAFGPGQFIVRTSGDASRLVPGVRAAVASLGPHIILTKVRPLTELVDDARSSTRFALVLIGIFAGIAVLLAAVGLYGVLSSAVRQRTSEIGIRMAFGAQSSTIFGQMLGEGLRLSAIGIGAGLVVALFATRVMQSMLVAVKPTDPLTFAAMIGLFLVVAALACWAPAHRAASLDPNAALREE